MVKSPSYIRPRLSHWCGTYTHYIQYFFSYKKKKKHLDKHQGLCVVTTIYFRVESDLLTLGEVLVFVGLGFSTP